MLARLNLLATEAVRDNGWSVPEPQTQGETRIVVVQLVVVVPVQPFSPCADEVT